MIYADLRETLRVFGLGERATIKDIKARRALVKRHHPDTGNCDDPEVELRLSGVA